MWGMPETDLYIKVTVEHDKQDQPPRLAAEVVRQVMRVYGVRHAELSSFVTREE